MRAVFRWWAVLVAATVLLQIAIAGYGAFYVVDKADNASKTLTNPLGFLHPVNAIAIAAVSGMLARIEWKGGAAATTVASADA